MNFGGGSVIPCLVDRRNQLAVDLGREERWKHTLWFGERENEQVTMCNGHEQWQCDHDELPRCLFGVLTRVAGLCSIVLELEDKLKHLLPESENVILFSGQMDVIYKDSFHQGS